MTRPKILKRPTPTIRAAASPSSRNELALAIVDDALTEFAGRRLITGHEVVNSLLDLRNALEAATPLGQLANGDLVSR